MKMSLFVVRTNDSPAGVTETGLGIMLFFDRSVGSAVQPANPASNTVTTIALTVISFFIVIMFIIRLCLESAGFKDMIFGS